MVGKDDEEEVFGEERRATTPPKDTVGRRHSGHPGRRMMKSRGEGVERDGETEGVDNEGKGRS